MELGNFITAVGRSQASDGTRYLKVKLAAPWAELPAEVRSEVKRLSDHKWLDAQVSVKGFRGDTLRVTPERNRFNTNGVDEFMRAVGGPETKWPHNETWRDIPVLDGSDPRALGSYVRDVQFKRLKGWIPYVEVELTVPWRKLPEAAREHIASLNASHGVWASANPTLSGRSVRVIPWQRNQGFDHWPIKQYLRAIGAPVPKELR